MGAGTGQHRNDPTASGVWRPMSASAFFSTGGGGIATFGGWDNQISSLSGLAQKVASSQLDPARRSSLLTQAEKDAMWTLYEKAVRYAAAIRSRVGLVNMRDSAGF